MKSYLFFLLLLLAFVSCQEPSATIPLPQAGNNSAATMQAVQLMDSLMNTQQRKIRTDTLQQHYKTLTNTAMSQKWDEVIAVHDEVMPDMSIINRLNDSLTTLLEAENTQLSKQQRMQAQLHLKALITADSLMFDWMGAFQQLEPLQSKMDYQEVMQYLQKEDERVGKVKSFMNSSITESRQFLSELAAN